MQGVMALRTLYLHIGTHKTGSSSLQKFLFENVEWLLTKGYYYPVEGRYFLPMERSQSLLAHSLRGERPNYIRAEVEYSKRQCVAELIADIESSSAPAVIISSEHFCPCDRVTLIELQQILEPLFDQIKIVVYLRRQDQRLESGYNQRVKTGACVDSFNKIATRILHDNKPHMIDYYSMLESYADIFGKPNIIVRPFEKEQLAGGSVIDDFLAILDVQSDSSVVRSTELNRSISTEMLVLIRTLVTGLPEPQRKKLSMLLRRLPLQTDNKRYTLCSPQMRSRILASSADSNSKVAREYLGRMDGQLYFQREENNLPLYPKLPAVLLVQASQLLWQAGVQNVPKTGVNLHREDRSQNSHRE